MQIKFLFKKYHFLRVLLQTLHSLNVSLLVFYTFLAIWVVFSLGMIFCGYKNLPILKLHYFQFVSKYPEEIEFVRIFFL